MAIPRKNGRGLSFDWGVRLDNMLVVVTMIVASVAFIYDGRTNDAVMKSRFEALTATVTRLEIQMAAVTTQVSALSTQLAVMAAERKR